MKKAFIKQSREYRLQKIEEKRQEILSDERGKGIFSTWCQLPEEEDFTDPRPMSDIYFTISLSRKYDDVYYLYMLDNYDSYAYLIAHGIAEKELDGERPRRKNKEDDFESMFHWNGNKGVFAPTEAQMERLKLFEVWSDKVDKRAAEIARNGIEITPYFLLNKNSCAGIEVIGVVDVKEFTADGTIEAINKFLDAGETEFEGEPILHIVSEEFLNK